MPLSDHVTISISQATAVPSRQGFGVPALVSHNSAQAALVEFHTSISSVVSAGFTTDSPEYLAASALFSQNPRPPRIAILKCPTKPTQRYSLNVAAVRNSHVYTIHVKGEGVTATSVTYTSDASATAGEIVVGLVTALNLVTGKNFTAAGATSPFTITGDAAGDWFSVEVDDVADLLVEQNHADPGIATNLAAALLENSEWYGLVTLYNSTAYVGAVAAWAETNKRLYAADSNDSESCTTAATNGDALDSLNTNAYSYSFGCYHPSPAEMFGASWLGKCLPKDPGSITWKYKTLSGVEYTTLTATHRTNLVARNANFYERVGGLNMTAEGTTADGDYIDVRRGLDWLTDDMQTEIFSTLMNNDKVDFDDGGVSLIEGAIRASLQRAVDRRILKTDPAPSVSVPKVADVSTADRGNRLLPDVEWTGELRGAVHKVTVTGTVTA